MLDLNKMLFCLPRGSHEVDEITKALREHPEVKFVSLVGVDIGGHDTDEKIPVELFIKDLEGFMAHGVQTDGSSVFLPLIAELNNAKVDIIPDPGVNWYVDYNYSFLSENGLPVGTLRVPSFLVHNDTAEVGARVILRDAVAYFQAEMLKLIKESSWLRSYLDIPEGDEVEEIIMTCATELEFWVKTPDDKADREQLSTAQILKEQYWKRTIGPVRTALEKTLLILERYGFEVEMGHKEVGGVKAKMGNSGNYDHVMEQLEIDWKYSTPLQAADNEHQVKYVVKDIFRLFGLEVSFMAKPIEGVAGSGTHTHMGLAAKLKSGNKISLFGPKDTETHFMSPVGFGAIMGLLKNYEAINPFISSTNDAFNRLKPGYEAPVCIVTSLGHSVLQPSRNRTVLAGLIRDVNNPLSARFELRSPNPKSNTYLVIAASYLGMLDGIKAAVYGKKTPELLLESLSKEYGEEDFYLETDRVYRSEKDVFKDYTPEEREKLFGKVPRTVWENLCAIKENPEKVAVFMEGNVMNSVTIESFRLTTLGNWATELHNRIVPGTRDLVRDCRRLHQDNDCTDLDKVNWHEIQELRVYLGQDSLKSRCLLSRIIDALDEENYQLASDLQIEMQGRVEELVKRYVEYKRNLL